MDFEANQGELQTLRTTWGSREGVQVTGREERRYEGRDGSVGENYGRKRGQLERELAEQKKNIDEVTPAKDREVNQLQEGLREQKKAVEEQKKAVEELKAIIEKEKPPQLWTQVVKKAVGSDLQMEVPR